MLKAFDLFLYLYVGFGYSPTYGVKTVSVS